MTTYSGSDYYLTGRINYDFLSLVADKDASRNNGKIYFAADDGFYVIDLENKVLHDKITKTQSKVSVDDKLEQENIVDLNVGGNSNLS